MTIEYVKTPNQKKIISKAMFKISKAKKYAQQHEATKEDVPVYFDFEIIDGVSAMIIELLPVDVYTKDYAFDETFGEVQEQVTHNSYKLAIAKEVDYEFEDLLHGDDILELANKDIRKFIKSYVNKNYNELLMPQG